MSFEAKNPNEIVITGQEKEIRNTEYNVKPGDTMLSILKKVDLKSDYAEGEIERAARASGYFQDLKVGDKIDFKDFGPYLKVYINGVVTKTKDGKFDSMFAKSEEIKKAIEEYRRKVTEEINNTKEKLAKFKEYENILKGSTVTKEAHGAYSFSVDGLKLDMVFVNEEALANAMKMINKIKETYNKEFTGEERPKFYAKNGTVSIDNGTFFDTKYLSEKATDLFKNKNLSSRTGKEDEELADFLNKLLKTK